jgi:hypothetical protein
MESIAVRDSLYKEDLDNLFRGDILAIKVPNFVPAKVCDSMKRFVYEQENQIQSYDHEESIGGEVIQTNFGVKRLGTPYNITFSTKDNTKEKKTYYQENRAFKLNLEKRVGEDQIPSNLLKNKLANIWNKGCEVAAFDKEKMFFGIIRITEPKKDLSEKFPHCDTLPPNIKMNSQLGANIYFDTPDFGGELEVWNTKLYGQEEIYDSSQCTDFSREELAKVKYEKIKPEQGDLILINTRKPHAIKKFEVGKRLSQHTFIGKDEDQSLRLWS